MTTIVEVNHDSGPPVSNHWNNITDSGARLSITGAAGLNSTAFGLQVGADGSNTAVGDVTMSPPGSNEIRMRLRTDEGTFNFAGSNGILFELTVNGSVGPFMRLIISKSGSVLSAQGRFSSDSASLGGFTASFNLPAGENCIEFAYRRDGQGARIYLNSVQQGGSGSLTTAANTFDAIDRLDFNCAVTPSGNSGNLYFDQMLTDDDEFTALCIAAASFDIITHGRQSALLFNQQAAPTLDGQCAFFVVEDTAGAQVRYIKMDVPVKDVLSTPMAQAHTDATDTDGMVTTTASPNKMFFAGNDAVGGFVESHAVSTGITTDLYSNAARAIHAMTSSPNLSSEALILESAGLVEEIRHTIDDFVTTQVTNDLSAFIAFANSSLAATFSKTPEQPSLRDMQAWLVGDDFVGSFNLAAFFIQLLTGSGIVVNDEAIAALQSAALITGIGIAT